MISKYSVKRPYTVLVMVVAILVLGFVSFIRMTPELYPNITMPYVAVMTAYPGAAPEEVEVKVTAPLEQQLATLEDLKEIQSSSSRGYSMILLEFESNANLDVISVDIRDKIGLVSGSFDETVTAPTIYKMNPNIIPTTIAAAGYAGKDAAQLSTFVEEDLLTRLEGIKGVASVSTAGLVQSTVHIALDPDKVKKLNDDLTAALNAKTDSAKNTVQSGIDSAQSGRGQVATGKEQIQRAQKQLATSREPVEQALQALQAALFTKETLTGAAGTTMSPEQVAAMEQAAKDAGLTDAQIKQLMTAMEQGRSDGQEQALAAVQQTIVQTVEVLKPYQNQLATLGVNLDSAKASSAGATMALSTFRVAMNVSSDELSNQMSELTATDAYLQSTIMQLQQTLTSIDGQAAGIKTTDLNAVLSAAGLSQIIKAENFDMPAGFVSDNGREAIVSVGEGFTGVEEIESLTVLDLGIEGFDPIEIRDVATVTYINNAEDVYAKINGENGVLLSFSKQSDVPTAQASDNIQEAMTALEEEYEGLSFHILSDQGNYIDIVIHSVLQNLLIGGLLAILILLLFLKDWKPTLITALSIPISLTFALVLMYFSGVTLNIISLAGLAVGVGMLVDNSIVVVENIYRLRQQGVTKAAAAVTGAGQVAGAITASTMTTICVFLPIVFVQGITRQLFTDMALTIGYSLLASLFIALTLVPAMGSRLLERISDKAWMTHGSSGFLKRYLSILDKALAHRAISLLLAVGLLVLSCVIVLVRGFEFMPGMASQEISASITMPKGTSNKKAMEISDRIAAQTGEVDGVETVGIMPSSSTGSIMGMSGGSPDFEVMSMYVLLDKEAIKDSAQVSKEIAAIGEAEGCEMWVTGETDMTTAMGSSDIVIDIFGTDLTSIKRGATLIEGELANIEGLSEISDINERTMPHVKVVVDKEKAMQQGMTVLAVYSALSTALSDRVTAGEMMYEGGRRDIVLSTGSGHEAISREELEDLPLRYLDPQTGKNVAFTLKDVAVIEEDTTLENIGRLNQNRGIRVTATVDSGYNITKMQGQVENKVAGLSLPSDLRVVYEGQNAEIMEAMADLIKMMALGLLLIYLVMVAQFQSLKSPFIILFTVPLAFTGGFIALLLTGNPLSVVSMIGFIVLMGVIVNNGIVLVDYMNRLRREGMEKGEAIRAACTARMRPVLMTAITTVLGLTPLAFGIGDGAEMIQPVAIVCMGGLLYATLMTLLIVPVAYDLLNKKELTVIREEDLESEMV